jgi:hypothetical protein
VETLEPVITVEPGDTLDTLLAQVAAAPGPTVVVRVPREARVPRDIEHFQALQKLARQRKLQVWVRSPVASIVGMAKIYGLESEFDSAAGERRGTGALEPPPAAAPPPPASVPSAEGEAIDWLLGDVDLDRLEAEAAAERGRSAAPPPAFLPSHPPPAGPPPSENDWLLDGLDATALEADYAAERGRSAAPPEFLAAGPLPSSPPVAPTPPEASRPPPAESDWPLGDADLASLDAAFAAERGHGATPSPDLLVEPPPTPPRAAATPPPLIPGHVPPTVLAPPPAGLVPLSPGALHEQDPLDSSVLPEWLVGGTPPAPVAPLPSTPPPARHLFAHGPAPKPGPRWVIPCPHCGEDIDFEMLLSIAEYRD